jgi:hypothetical protein
VYSDHIEKVIPEDLLEKQDLPRIVIISVSVIGIFLLIINIGLVAGCMLKRRAKRIRGLFLIFNFYNLQIEKNENSFTCCDFQNKVIKRANPQPSKCMHPAVTTIQ